MSKEKIELNISGMTCVNCSNGIERVVNRLDGLEASKVSFTENRGEFTINSEKLDKNTIIQKIRKLGYGVEEDLKALEKAKRLAYNQLKRSFIIAAILTLLMFYFALFPLKEINLYLMFAIGTIVQFYPGARFYILSYKALSNKNSDMNVLVALGTSAAYFYSAAVVLFPHFFPQHLRFVYFDGASVIITFILLGRLLEERSRAKATDYLKKLMNLAPKEANKIEENGEISHIQAEELKVDDLVLVKQGEEISADGIIIEGTADIDTSMITGESLPVFKTIGDDVVAGTINTQGVLKIKVTKRANENRISNIIALLSSAGSKKLPIARLADTIASIFVPTVVGISIMTFFIWYFIAGDSLHAILTSITVLIISCPCALGLATPIAIVSAVGKGAKEGILIKNPEILEIIKEIKYAVFDKTGTLTKGEISIKDIMIESGYLDIVASIETHSEHPISKAIVTYAKKHNAKTTLKVTDVNIIAGYGISAIYQNKNVRIGSMAFLQESKVTIAPEYQAAFTKALTEGNGAVLVSVEDTCVGVISLEDRLRVGAHELISELKAKGITPVLLSGDNQITAQKIADDLKIESFYAQVLPDEKFEVIKKLQHHNTKVMFIGDGINDAPSIKQADIGITLNSGSDITKDAGDIILINNNIHSVLKSINLSEKAMRTIKQNLFWAFIYNAIGIPLAAGIFYPVMGIMLTPMYAGIAMSFSSVTVVLNSLRLKMQKI
ncbi:heavy metal translocating P-type ATPase [Sulfurospirillum sp. 1612]|uniref:heavy metal translocating P-type ATPase n=1 Tax=Sulfurospirillum sp. 1612 TaxID=3094835 RepID=UPI002F953156